MTGDQIIAICAAYYKQQGRLHHDRVVTTVMSNMGLTEALERLNIAHEKTDVGDRQVLSRMRGCGALVGGEDSGHMIFLDHHTTGDGILAALVLLEVMTATGRPLSELAKIMSVFPQVLQNVPVRQKPDIRTLPTLSAAIADVERSLGKKGRVLIRYSGTEPLCRIMVEGPDQHQCLSHAGHLAGLVETHLGPGRGD